MQLDTFFQFIYGFFDTIISQPLRSFGIPFGPGDWFFIIYTLVFVILIVLIRRRGKGGGDSYKV